MYTQIDTYIAMYKVMLPYGFDDDFKVFYIFNNNKKVGKKRGIIRFKEMSFINVFYYY